MKSIKLIVYILVLSLISSCGITTSNMAFSTYKNGYWGSWYNYREKWAFYGTPDSFIVYNSYYHPSQFTYRVTINNYNSYRVSSGKFEEFSGTLEYFDELRSLSADEFVTYTIDHLSPGYGNLHSHKAKILVKKEKYRYIYNIFFDNVGFGVTIPWHKVK